jgi:uncharacterized membrane protein YphA (DoxX/SURF4 family)
MSALVLILRLILGGIFLYAGLVKAGAGQAFAVALIPFTFIPIGWTGPLAYMLAGIEILAGLLILLPRIYEAGAALMTGLCIVFIGVLTWALMNGVIVSCGCFGEDEVPSAARMLAAIGRDVLIFAAAVAVIAMPRFARSRGTSTPLAPSASNGSLKP